MKHILTTLVAVALLLSCNSVKNIYSDDNINERQFDKLIKIYLKTPKDTAAANRVVFAYNQLHNEQLATISHLQNDNTLQSMERLINAYDQLQDFYRSAS